MPVRILLVFTILNRGGAETMVMNYFRAIDRSKVIFDFLVHRPERGEYENEIESLGGKIYRLPALKLLQIKGYKLAVNQFFTAHPEYQMIHGHCSELGYYIYKEAYLRNFKFIAAHAHNYPKGVDLKMPVRNILKYLMRPYLTHRFTCGKDSAKWLFGKELAKTAVFIPNAIDTSIFLFNPTIRSEVRKKERWDNRFVVGNIARFSHQKNHLFLIDVFVELLLKEPTSLLILVGSGGEAEVDVKKKVKQMGVTQNVLFLNSRSDISELLQGMDVFLFPSFFEGLSVAMVEAQAAGLKIITSTGVPSEVAIIPEAVDFLSLKLTARAWATHTLDAVKRYQRRGRYEEIIQSGFDIKSNAQWLQNFYLEQSLH